MGASSSPAYSQANETTVERKSHQTMVSSAWATLFHALDVDFRPRPQASDLRGRFVKRLYFQQLSTA